MRLLRTSTGRVTGGRTLLTATRPRSQTTRELSLGGRRLTLLISLGVKPKLVRMILRHSRLATTMDLYVHAYDEDLRGAVATLDRALGSRA
jgi:hypothetical protein